MAYIEIGENIKNARKRAGINQETLAELACLNRVTVAKYESGKVEPGAQALTRIAEALEISVDELLGIKPSEDTKQPDNNAPVTTEAKLLAEKVDEMPEEERKRAVRMMELMFEHYFNKGD